ncbi:hypothetical protein E0H45_28125 [Kribbella soli]|uniref:Cobalamin-independent methionine synthase MetE C-terminal/archaeal domain-containing protein n=1 Tax=Kribbella soli TaxID=1124743 RepID=A0A4V6N3J4_9ACTN|nr:hypothetical protein E0H45_28125 [Kribbella soli]
MSTPTDTSRGRDLASWKASRCWQRSSRARPRTRRSRGACGSGVGLAGVGFRRGVGPGVYDIHSPRVPTVEELAALIQAALATTPADQLWINPDCGLKTRTYAEIAPALRNLTTATQQLRAML